MIPVGNRKQRKETHALRIITTHPAGPQHSIMSQDLTLFIHAHLQWIGPSCSAHNKDPHIILANRYTDLKSRRTNYIRPTPSGNQAVSACGYSRLSSYKHNPNLPFKSQPVRWDVPACMCIRKRRRNTPTRRHPIYFITLAFVDHHRHMQTAAPRFEPNFAQHGWFEASATKERADLLP